MAIYVNDLKIVGPILKIIEELKIHLSQRFKMIDLGPTSYYLRIEVSMSEKNSQSGKKPTLRRYLNQIR